MYLYIFLAEAFFSIFIFPSWSPTCVCVRYHSSSSLPPDPPSPNHAHTQRPSKRNQIEMSTSKIAPSESINKHVCVYIHTCVCSLFSLVTALLFSRLSILYIKDFRRIRCYNLRFDWSNSCPINK